MKNESRVIKRIKEQMMPLKAKEGMIRGWLIIDLVILFICIFGAFILPQYKVLLIALMMLSTFGAIILGASYKKYMFKLLYLEALPNQMEGIILDNKLTEDEIRKLDELIENSEDGICSFKVDSSLVTFTSDFIFSYEMEDEIAYINLCKIKDVDNIKIINYVDKDDSLKFSSVSFNSGDNLLIGIDYSTTKDLEATERISGNIDEYLTNVPITEEKKDYKEE